MPKISKTGTSSGQMTFTPNFGINKTLGQKLFANASPAYPSFLYNFCGGINTNYKFNKKSSINADLKYSPKDFEFTPNHVVKSHFLEMQYSYEYSIFKFLSVQCGILAGINLFEENYGTATRKSNIQPITSNLNGFSLNRQDIGFLVGVKVHFKRIILFSNYSNSIAPITKIQFTDENANVINLNNRLRNIQIGVGYVFGKM